MPVNGFMCFEYTSQFNEDFVKSYKEEIDGYDEVDVRYPKELHELHNGLPLLHERLKSEKVEQLLANLYHQKEYVKRISNLKQALNHGLVLKKVYRVIKFNQI